jgi:hypothetical protein
VVEVLLLLPHHTGWESVAPNTAPTNTHITTVPHSIIQQQGE